MAHVNGQSFQSCHQANTQNVYVMPRAVNDDSDSSDEDTHQHKGTLNIRVHVGPVIGCCNRDGNGHAPGGQLQHTPRVVPPPAKRCRRNNADSDADAGNNANAETQTSDDPYYMPPNISQAIKYETCQRKANVRWLSGRIEAVSQRLAELEEKPVGNPYVLPIENMKEN